MSWWNIDVHAARGVIGHARAGVDGFEQAMRTANGNLAGVESLAACSPRVVQAVQASREALDRDHAEATVQASAVTTAGDDALGAYNQGDHEMVLNAQRNAGSATDPTAWLPGGANV